MAGNPFYVDPMGGYGESIVQGLSGLGSVIAAKQEEKRKKAEQDALMQEAQDVFASNDPMRISQFYLKSPEFGKRVQESSGFKNKATEQNMLDSMNRILAGEDPELVIPQRVEFLRSVGADPTQSIQELDVYRQNPQAYKGIVEEAFIRRFPDEAIKIREASKPFEGQKLSGNAANVAQLMFGTSDMSQLTPEQRQQVLKETGKSGKDVSANIEEYRIYQSQGGKDSLLDFINKKAGRGVGIDLSTYAEKQLSEANTQAVEAYDNISKYTALADEVEAANFSGGIVGGSWREKYKDVTGQQDAVTELRKKYNVVKASQAVKNLPPGAASDPDIKLALSGFPGDNAGSKELASFLRGTAKLEEFRAQYSEFKANYISENKTESGLLKAWKSQNGQDGEAKPEKAKPSASKFSDAAIAAAAKARGLTPEKLREALK